MAGTETRVELVEPAGGSIEVLVLDEDGRPLPFATVAVKQPCGLDWLDLDEQDVQRVDPFTDERGRRVLAHVEPGPVELSVAWGSRSAKASVAVVEGRPASARVVLASPSGP